MPTRSESGKFACFTNVMEIRKLSKASQAKKKPIFFMINQKIKQKKRKINKNKNKVNTSARRPSDSWKFVSQHFSDVAKMLLLLAAGCRTAD